MVNNMENAEEVMQILERFTRLKQKEIPKELDEYLQYVAKTGDTVFKWSSLKYLFREKLLNVIKHFHDTTPRVDEIPQYPNVDPFNYESMKSSLLERLELFNAAPFTIQRLCELLIDPRKQYSRIDKFMRALEKNILVSTIEPGRKRTESENGDSLDSVVNGDLSLDVNVDIDMENESLFQMETQNGNGTAAVAAAAAAVAEADAAATAEDEVKDSKPVTETPNVSHAADDDILPNPKKAKLDLDVADEKTKPSEVESVKTANAVTAVATAVTEEIKADAETVDATKSISVTAESIVAEEKAALKDVAPKSESSDVNAKANADEEKSTVAVEQKKAETSVEDNKAQSEQKGETIVDAAMKTDTAPEVIKNNEEKDATVEVVEKIIEKQEVEKCEKEEITTKAAAAAAVAAETELADVEKAVDAEAKAAENVEKKVTAVEKHVSGSNEKEKSDEEKVIAAVVEDANKTPNVNKSEEDTQKEKSTDIPAEHENKSEVAEKVTAQNAKADAETAKEATAAVEKAKSDEEISTPHAAPASVEQKKTDDNKDDKDVAKGENHNEENKTTNGEEKITTTTAAEAVAVAVATTNDAVKEKATANAEIPTAATPIETDSSPLAPIEDDVLPAIAATAAAVVNEPAIAAAVVTAVVGPTLALNDQPMEDVPPPTVEEVVMAETGSATEVMATDAIEPSKEELAGMEIDDTSQEAMDQ